MSWRVVALMGTASPTPAPATAVLTPIIRPELSASTPPLLPGLSAASVWMTSSITRPARVGNDRPSADTMPAVTLPAKPSGLPSATTSCPTRNRAASPRGTGAGTSPRARNTARSDSGSRPTTSASTSVPSAKRRWPVPRPRRRVHWSAGIRRWSAHSRFPPRRRGAYEPAGLPRSGVRTRQRGPPPRSRRPTGPRRSCTEQRCVRCRDAAVHPRQNAPRPACGGGSCTKRTGTVTEAH